MRTRRLAGTAVAAVLTLSAGGCFGPPTPQAAPLPAPPQSLTIALPPPTYPAYPVGVRALELQRSRSRPLPTLIFYPATDPTRTELTAGRSGRLTDGRVTATRAERRAGAVITPRVESVARAGLPPTTGRFPLVLFSHGLSSSAERYAPFLAELAAAGFVVAAPAYPHTSELAARFRRADIVSQPDDARYVLTRVLRLNNTPGDPLRQRIDAQHIAAVGHSAGGFTTTGLFTAGHDPRLRAGVVMAGWAAPGAFAGPPARMLFLQGTADPVVPMAVSREAWKKVPWPKAYVLLRRNSHSTYLQPGDLGYATVKSTVTDFLRWTLAGDESAHLRLPRMIYPDQRP